MVCTRFSRNTILKRNVLVSMLFIFFLFASANAIEPGGPSLSQQAENALNAGDPEAASNLYYRWLQASPSDYSGWYNYACALALLEQRDEAVEALDDAVTAGWRNDDWMSRDPDLQSLHTMDEFYTVIQRIQDLRLLEEQRDSVRSTCSSFITQTRLAHCNILWPANFDEQGDPYQLIILLHGRGADYTHSADLAERLALPNVVYALPRAPYHVDNTENGFEYWPRDLVTNNDTLLLAEARHLMADWVRDIIRSAGARTNIDTSNVILIGFSQGGAAAYVSVMEHPEYFHGLGVLGGYVPNEYLTSEWFHALGSNPVELFIGHGDRDIVRESSEIDQYLRLAEDAGVPVTMRLYPVGHSISDEMVVDLADWISRLRAGRSTD